jgi:16S rRNA (cytidine1402-2'-O)-methyltransferase
VTDTDPAALAARDAAVRMVPEAVEAGVLHIVSTPIGHLGDLSLRALAVLAQADRILCEDTRHARTLLGRYGIRTPTTALHEHNEARSTEGIVAALAAGRSLALISDAGTPLVSDPGERLVRAVLAAGHRVVPVPGASAALAALVGAGLPAHPSTILGFLPRKGGERTRVIDWAVRCPHSTVVYESPARLAATLAELASVAGPEREVVVARELTKRFEEFRRGTLGALAAYYSDNPPKGELVIVLSAAPPAAAPTPTELRETVVALRADGASARSITETLMTRFGVSRNEAYQLAHES